MESLLVTNDLDSNHLSSLVISTLQNLTERAFAEDVDDFVAIMEVIMRDE